MTGNCSSLGVGTTPGCSSIADSPDDTFAERPVCASADRAKRPKAAVQTASSHAALQLSRTTDLIHGLSGVCFSSNVSIELKIAAPKLMSAIVHAHFGHRCRVWPRHSWKTCALSVGAQASGRRASCFNYLAQAKPNDARLDDPAPARWEITGAGQRTPYLATLLRKCSNLMVARADATRFSGAKRTT